jgi:hypothetical protein
MADKKPLWEVMLTAKIQYTRTNSSPTYGGEEATRLLAIADVVVPEEPRPGVFDDGYTCGARDARLDIRAKLLQAAAEAEERGS